MEKLMRDDRKCELLKAQRIRRYMPKTWLYMLKVSDVSWARAIHHNYVVTKITPDIPSNQLGKYDNQMKKILKGIDREEKFNKYMKS